MDIPRDVQPSEEPLSKVIGSYSLFSHRISRRLTSLAIAASAAPLSGSASGPPDNGGVTPFGRHHFPAFGLPRKDRARRDASCPPFPGQSAICGEYFLGDGFIRLYISHPRSQAASTPALYSSRVLVGSSLARVIKNTEV
eukprot:9228802-Pyramimonas_sp.AAC.1